MFETLPEKLREKNLKADIKTLLVLRKAIDADLVSTLGDIYNVLKNLVVKDNRDLGPFTKVFYDYFLNIDILNGETLNDAIIRSSTFKQWLEDRDFKDRELDLHALSNQFLDEVHTSQYDIKEILNGKDIWQKDDPELEDGDGDSFSDEQKRLLQQMADYSDMTLEELLERMREVAKQQKTKHSGGSHWIGTGGISPYGHGGAALNGIRVGGTGGGKMARKVIGNQNFYPVDMNKRINDDNIDAAIASLKGIVEESGKNILDIESTINKGLKRGGLFIPELKNKTEEKLQVILLIDNGGYSMDPYISLVQELFKKMKTRFAHDMEVYYFHNTIYDRVFTNQNRSKYISIDRFVKKHDPNYRVFFIGDASMSPYELNQMSIRNYLAMTEKYKKIVWLNPEPEQYWSHTYTLNIIKEIIPMFPLTPNGIEKAVRSMNGIS